MKSTLNDLKKYLAMYLNEGKTPEGIRILGSTGIREMCRPRQIMERLDITATVFP